MVKMQAAVEGGAIDSSINSPLGQKISLKLKNNHKNSKKAFSVAEAMIALLIGSLALGMAAPMITKQVKFQNMTDTQNRVLVQKMRELENRIQELENEDGSIPSGAVMFFNSAVKPESNTNPCPVGWTKIDDNWNGRFPRFAGSYTVLGYNTSTKKFNTTGTAQTLGVGALQEDAIRNITGRSGDFEGEGTTVGNNGALSTLRSSGGWEGGHWATRHRLEFDASLVVPTDSENRPKSVALLGCVRN